MNIVLIIWAVGMIGGSIVFIWALRKLWRTFD